MALMEVFVLSPSTYGQHVAYLILSHLAKFEMLLDMDLL